MASKKLTAWQQEQLEAAKKIAEYKLSAEANVCACIYKEPELLYDLDLKLEDFSNNIWKVFFSIAVGVILKEKKNTLDEITVGIYLEKHKKLKDKFQEYGAYGIIADAQSYVNVSNLDAYCIEIKKWNVVHELLKYGFPVAEKLNEYADKTIEEIYDQLEMMLNHSFISSQYNIESYNVFDNMDEYIDSLNECEDVGMPLYNSTLLNDEIAGLHKGNIMGIGAASGVGKSWLAFNLIIPSALEHNEKVCMICNEESERRYQLELLIWCLNTVFKHDVHKYELRNGEFSDELMGWLREAAAWLKEKADQHILTVIPLQTYTADIAIKIIKKYSSVFGVETFIVDTLKSSSDSKVEDMSKSIMTDVLKFYDLIKPSNRNLALVLTYQLNKQSLKVRHLTNMEIGWAKGIIDTMSVNILVRKPNNDEYDGGSHQLKCYRLEGKDKISFTLNKDENYLLIFLSKNRHGRTDPYQIVAKINQSTNKYEEIGITYIAEDW